MVVWPKYAGLAVVLAALLRTLAVSGREEMNGERK